MQDARSNGPNAIMSRGLPDDWTDTSFDHVSHFPVRCPCAPTRLFPPAAGHRQAGVRKPRTADMPAVMHMSRRRETRRCWTSQSAQGGCAAGLRFAP